MKKKFILSLIFTLVWTSIANAEIYFRGAGSWAPEQEISASVPTADFDFDINQSFGALGEVGVYSKEKLLSFGIQGTFENLRAFNPVAGVESVDAELYSLMGNMCMNVENKSKITPYACGSVGMYWLDPSLSVPGGALVNFDSSSASGYGAEAGLKVKTSKDFSLFGSIYWRDTFNDFVVGAGVPGTGVEVDVGHYGFLAGFNF